MTTKEFTPITIHELYKKKTVSSKNSQTSLEKLYRLKNEEIEKLYYELQDAKKTIVLLRGTVMTLQNINNKHKEFFAKIIRTCMEADNVK